MSTFNKHDLEVLSGIDLGNVKAHIDPLRSTIVAAILDFERETGMYVSHIGLERAKVFMTSGEMLHSGINVNIDVSTEL